MVDPADDLTDVRMPESGTEGHATLLLAEFLASTVLASTVLAGNADRSVALDELHRDVRRQAAEHRVYWRRSAGDPGAEIELTTVALDRLEALHLIRRTGETVTALPALARYAVTEPTIQESS